ncbi:MAG TPA: folylpolyglutamate synthase/dihydrofolate synthase family protein, partial [Longimicrobiaceae bacterium]|nr:folylpolyglutamate synthase/dihydrofolate synthase family protein [Longimicrobiaceae bacterium]
LRHRRRAARVSAREPGAWLFDRPAGGIRWGLERTEALLAGADHPHRRFRSIHIAGTNGKGSVSAFCESALRAARPDRLTGLYTSPHLVSFAERIRIGGRPVGRELLLACEARLRPAIEASGATFFEATTAIAFLCFAEAGVDTAVIEVGLGGRLDSTNVIDPLACAVTNVALDHVEYLGDSVAAIAAEKAGIFKRGVPAITAERDPESLAVLRRVAAAAGAPLTLLDDAARIDGVAVDLEGTRFRMESQRWGTHELRIGLIGEHQARNAALAAELLGLLPDDVRPGWEAIRAGFAATRWPGRLQVERRGELTRVFDVAHNPAGVAALVNALRGLDLPRPVVLVAGILADKDWREMLPPLVALADGAILTVPPTAPAERRWNPDEAARELVVPAAFPLRVITDFPAALARAETLAPYGTVLVTGSFHTVGDAMEVLGMEAV